MGTEPGPLTARFLAPPTDAAVATRASGWADAVIAAAWAPVDAASLVAFRFLFGTLMVVSSIRFLAHGWVAEYFLLPRHFFHYLGFEWVRPWPAPLMYAHFVVMAVAAACIALGVFHRIAAAVFCALFTYAHLIDKTNYLNHYYLVSLLSLLLVFLPVSAGAGVRWRPPHPWRTPASAPAWALWTVRFQLAAVYFFGGVAKLGKDWLLHAQPLTIWLRGSTELPLLGPLFEHKATAYALSYAGAAFDLSVVPLLLWRRSRPFAFAALVAFHLLTARLFQLGMFPWIMIGCALVFFPPEWPRRAWALLARRGSAKPPASTAPGQPSRRVALGLAALALYALVQVAVPMRHLLYPGDVLWTEEGFRFSWRVMLTEKNGTVELEARDPASGHVWSASPDQYLTAYQTKMMATQPDMILELCHIVADDFRARGYPAVEVRARADVSLNGRPAQPLVDSSVDLARVRDGLGPAPWVVPLADSTPGF